MLSSDGDAGRVRHFFHLSTGKSLRLHLLELDHRRIIRYADSLLVLQDKATTVVTLLNPFTKSLTRLPPLAMLMDVTREELDHLQVTNAVVSFSLASGLSTIMLSFYHLQRLAFANVDDDRWLMTIVSRISISRAPCAMRADSTPWITMDRSPSVALARRPS